jgi:hypothetical protein
MADSLPFQKGQLWIFNPGTEYESARVIEAAGAKTVTYRSVYAGWYTTSSRDTIDKATAYFRQNNATLSPLTEAEYRKERAAKQKGA